MWQKWEEGFSWWCYEGNEQWKGPDLGIIDWKIANCYRRANESSVKKEWVLNNSVGMDASAKCLTL